MNKDYDLAALIVLAYESRLPRDRNLATAPERVVAMREVVDELRLEMVSHVKGVVGASGGGGGGKGGGLITVILADAIVPKRR